MNGKHEYLPIKVIIPADRDLRPPPPGGGKAKPFDEIYDFDAARETLLTGIQVIEEKFSAGMKETGLPVVARVTLQEKALAKSYRPYSLFSRRTCEIIGGENFDELLVSVRPRSLRALAESVEKADAAKVRNDISKIRSIEPYDVRDVLGNWTRKTLIDYLRENEMPMVKLRLFNHRDPEMERMLVRALSEVVHGRNGTVLDAMRYAPGLRIFSIPVARAIERIDELAAFVGTQSLDVFDEFTVSAQSNPVQPMVDDDLPPPTAGVTYPVVGMIDSGTDPDNDRLQAWVETRDETLIPRIDQDNEHGSLVAGLMINGRALNHGHEGFPSGRSKVVDVVAIPGSGKITEPDLLDSLHHAFTTHRDVKIWNMSLNSSRLCRNDKFSHFAMSVDALQDQHGVLIINSAGNFEGQPAYGWPRPDLNDRDRICSPSESLRSLTVGSIAHIGHKTSCVKPGEPSPFSRKGPGAAFAPKPEVTHIGGNTNSKLQWNQMGVLSIDASGNVAETVGTSFATPLVSTTVAHLAGALQGETSRHLLKAFTIHSAVLNTREITAADLPYTGFGKPPDVSEMLRCNPWEATLVFDIALPFHKRHFHKTDFPIPPCLHRDGKVFGEIIMTMVYDPPVDANDGASYSLVNIDASLGLCWINGSDEKYGGRKVIPYPKDIGEMYEKSQIEHGFKWSPVKVFRARFSHITPRDTWRITMEMSARKALAKPLMQPVALIVTIRDPDKHEPVYNEVVQMMNRAGWITQNLQVREALRLRAGR